MGAASCSSCGGEDRSGNGGGRATGVVDPSAPEAAPKLTQPESADEKRERHLAATEMRMAKAKAKGKGSGLTREEEEVRTATAASIANSNASINSAEMRPVAGGVAVAAPNSPDREPTAIAIVPRQPTVQAPAPAPLFARQATTNDPTAVPKEAGHRMGSMFAKLWGAVSTIWGGAATPPPVEVQSYVPTDQLSAAELRELRFKKLKATSAASAAAAVEKQQNAAATAATKAAAKSTAAATAAADASAADTSTGDAKSDATTAASAESAPAAAAAAASGAATNEWAAVAAMAVVEPKPDAKSAPAPKPEAKPEAKSPPPPQQTPAKSKSKSKSKLAASPSPSAPSTAAATPTPAPAVATPPPAPAPVVVRPLKELRAEWEHALIAEVLVITLTKSDAASSGRVFLPDSFADLTKAALAQAADATAATADAADSKLAATSPTPPVLFSRDHLDTVIVERLSLLTAQTTAVAPSPLAFLLTCWKRATERMNALSGTVVTSKSDAKKEEALSGDTEWKRAAIEALMSRIVSYSGLVLLDNHVLDYNARIRSLHEFDRLLEADAMARGFPPQFLHALITHYTEAGGTELDDLFNPCINSLIKKARQTPSIETFQKVCGALSKIVGYPSIAHLVTNHTTFNPAAAAGGAAAMNGRLFEMSSLLGPFLSAAPNPRDAAFQNILTRTQVDVDDAAKLVQQQLFTYQTTVFQLIHSLLKSDNQSKEAMLNWLSRVIKLNKERKKMRYDPNRVASEGFWINLSVVLTRLCHAIIVPTAANRSIDLLIDSAPASDSAVDVKSAPAGSAAAASGTRIDPFYLFSADANARVDYSSETRVRATPIELLSLRVALEPNAKLQSAGTVPLTDFTATASTAAATATTPATTPAATAAAPVASAAPPTAPAPAAAPAVKPPPAQLPVYTFPKRAFNLSTELFFLTHELLSIGLVKCTWIYNHHMQELGRLKQETDRAEADGHHDFAQQQAQVLGQAASATFALRAHLADENNLSSLASFYNWSSLWILRVFELYYNQQPASAGSDARAAAASRQLFAVLPESLIDNIIDFYAFLGRYHHPMLMAISSSNKTSASSSAAAAAGGDRTQGLFALIMATIAGPLALKNSAIRSKMGEILALFLPEEFRQFREPQFPAPRLLPSPFHVFLTDPALNRRLVPALLELYCDCEHGPNQYYEKFKTRHLLSQLLEFLWECPTHQRIFISLATNAVSAAAAADAKSDAKAADTKSDSKSVDAAAGGYLGYGSGETFTRFVNFLLNDTIYLLDESLKALTEIHSEQTERKDDAKWRTQAPNVLRERDAAFAQRENAAITYGQLALSTVHTLYYLTSKIVTSFVSDEFVARVAGVVDYFIMQLNGPKVSELRVEEPAKYYFYPRVLAAEMVGIFLHLSSSDKFVEAVASDERSYKPDVFAKAAKVMRRKGIMSSDAITRFERALERVATVADARRATEEVLGDIPEKFLDAIACTLMTDPVTLPMGKQNVDRSTIKRHLLNTPKDPFTRAPLTMEMIIPNPELKAEIESWIATKRAEKKAAAASGTTVAAPAATPAPDLAATAAAGMNALPVVLAAAAALAKSKSANQKSADDKQPK